MKRRAAADPGVLKLLRQKLQIDVEVSRHTVTADSTSALGMTAQLIAEDWFGEPRTSTAAWNELKQRGFAGAAARIYEACEKPNAMGFLTNKGKGVGYRPVESMKVNIVERRTAA